MSPGTVNYCRNGCGVQLKFDPYRKSPSGKMIPLEAHTGEPHQCPKSQYALKQQNQQPQQQSSTNFGTVYSGNELGRETKAIKYEDVDDSEQRSNDITILTLIQKQTTLLQDIKDALLQVLHPNPETTTAKDLADQMGLSDDYESVKLERVGEDKTANE
jgi:hypothetical protein